MIRKSGNRSSEKIMLKQKYHLDPDSTQLNRGLDDRRPRLPVPDRLKGMDQYNDVQGEVIADVKPDQNLEHKRDRDRQRNRQLSRQQETHHHGEWIGNRIEDA